MPSSKILPIILFVGLLIIPAHATETWRVWVESARRDLERTTNEEPRRTSALVKLRRAWMSVDSTNLNSKPYKEIKALLVDTYREEQWEKLARLYERATTTEIDQRIRAKALEGRTAFVKGWHVCMDKNQTLIFKKVRGTSASFELTPVNETYNEALTLTGRLAPGEEKPVDFDLSAIGQVDGPSTYPVW